MNYHALLAHFPKISYARYQILLARFLNLENLWEAELEEIIQAGLEENIAYEFLMWREKLSPENIFKRLNKECIQTFSLGDIGYPKLLAQINDPPHTIFVRGKLPDDSLATVGVVGTRRITTYGKMMCEDIVGALARQNIVVVSGLALGVDGVAHETTLKNKGITIAVLGGSICKEAVYPMEHRRMAEQIVANGGALVSEYPPDFEAKKFTFPARNRIIAGLSLGTLVIEAPAQSGALITARHSLDYNREVFAIPHSITSPTGVGPNNLIKMGAKLVTEPNDILDTLNLQTIKQNVLPLKPKAQNDTEAMILGTLSREPKHINQIIAETILTSSAINSAMVMLEMRGIVRNLGGMNYVLTK